MAALDNFARLDHRSRMRRKRGGGQAVLPLEAMTEFEPGKAASPEELFLKEWARSVLSEALDEMERAYSEAGLSAEFRLFVDKDIDPPLEKTSYESLADQFKMSVAKVTSALYQARKKLRELVLIRVRDTVTTEDEAEAEMRDLFGGGPRA